MDNILDFTQFSQETTEKNGANHSPDTAISERFPRAAIRRTPAVTTSTIKKPTLPKIGGSGSVNPALKLGGRRVPVVPPGKQLIAKPKTPSITGKIKTFVDKNQDTIKGIGKKLLSVGADLYAKHNQNPTDSSVTDDRTEAAEALATRQIEQDVSTEGGEVVDTTPDNSGSDAPVVQPVTSVANDGLVVDASILRSLSPELLAEVLKRNDLNPSTRFQAQLLRAQAALTANQQVLNDISAGGNSSRAIRTSTRRSRSGENAADPVVDTTPGIDLEPQGTGFLEPKDVSDFLAEVLSLAMEVDSVDADLMVRIASGALASATPSTFELELSTALKSILSISEKYLESPTGVSISDIGDAIDVTFDLIDEGVDPDDADDILDAAFDVFDAEPDELDYYADQLASETEDIFDDYGDILSDDMGETLVSEVADFTDGDTLYLDEVPDSAFQDLDDPEDAELGLEDDPLTNAVSGGRRSLSRDFDYGTTDGWLLGNASTGIYSPTVSGVPALNALITTQQMNTSLNYLLTIASPAASFSALP